MEHCGGLPLYINILIGPVSCVFARRSTPNVLDNWFWPPTFVNPSSVGTLPFVNSLNTSPNAMFPILFPLRPDLTPGWKNIKSLELICNGSEEFHRHVPTLVDGLTRFISNLSVPQRLSLDYFLLTNNQADYNIHVDRPLWTLGSPRESRLEHVNLQTLALLVVIKPPILATPAIDCSGDPTDQKPTAPFLLSAIPPELIRPSVRNVLLYSIAMHADIITILSSVPNAKYLTISIPKRGLDLEHLRLGTGCLCPNLEGLTVRPAPQPSFKQFRRLVGSRLPTSQCLRLGGSLVTARKDERHPAWLKKHVNFQLMADGGMKFEQALDYMQRRA